MTPDGIRKTNLIWSLTDGQITENQQRLRVLAPLDQTKHDEWLASLDPADRQDFDEAARLGALKNSLYTKWGEL